MRQSLRIIEQAVKQIPEPRRSQHSGAGFNSSSGRRSLISTLNLLKVNWDFFIVSDNSIAPYRYHVRAPCFINLTALREMVIGWKIADAIVIFGSIDICMGEVDR